MSQNRSLEYFCKALLAPGREPIVAAPEVRGFSRARLEALLALVVKINATGGNLLLPRPLEAVRREAEAVAAQQAHGRACRPMIRAAVQGDEELLRMWARC